jgi:hypothetical protein
MPVDGITLSDGKGHERARRLALCSPASAWCGRCRAVRKVTLHPPEFSYIVITDAAAVGHVVALGGWAERGQWQEAPVRLAVGRRAARLAGYWQRP